MRKTMARKSEIKPLEKQYGEQLTINKPDVASMNGVSVGDNPFDKSFYLIPDLPSHVPTPATIDEGMAGIHRQLQTIFTADEGVTTPTKKRNRRRKNLQSSPADPQQAPPSTPITPDHSPYSTKAMKILIASPHGTKWGPDVWRSKMRPSFSRPSTVNKRPSSPSDVASELKIARELSNSPTASPKVILSEEVVETVERNHSSPNNKTYSASPLQLRWIEENALNLHSSCNNLSGSDNPSARRSRFLFRPRARKANFEFESPKTGRTTAATDLVREA